MFGPTLARAAGRAFRLLASRSNHPFPQTVVIDSVSFCNLKCSMCAHRDMEREKGRMKWTLFKKIVDEVAAVAPGTRLFLVFFGEPLIIRKKQAADSEYRDIFEMIRYCKSVGISDVALNSNGNILDRSSSRQLIDAGLNRLYVGIDAITPETYAKHRVGGDYEKVVRNVLDFKDELLRSGRRDCRLQVQFVETADNAHELQGFIQFWKQHDVPMKVRKRVTWAGLVPTGDKLQTASARHNCYWAMNTLAVTHVGDVAMCPADPEARHVFGNLENESIAEIWRGPLGEQRKLQKSGRWKQLESPCKECGDWAVSYDDAYVSGNPIRLAIEYLATRRRSA